MNETPMLFPIAHTQFWKQIRTTIEEVVTEKLNQQTTPPIIPSLPEKALLKASEVCETFRVSKPTLMECVKDNQIGLVDYFYFLGYQPLKTKYHEHWYLSPFRKETEVSFKVNKLKNLWCDQGTCQSRNIIEFIAPFFKCDQAEALKILFF